MQADRRSGRSPEMLPEAERELMRGGMSWPKVAVLAAAVVYPGAALGALAAYWFWTAYRTPSKYRAIASLIAGAVGILGGALIPIWISGDIVAGTFYQVLVGPALLFGAHKMFLSHMENGGTEEAGVQVTGEATRPTAKRKTDEVKAVKGEPSQRESPRMYIGKTISGSRRVLLDLPEAIERNVTVAGDTGTGKTTTLTRIIRDALAAGYPVIVADFKGVGSLRPSLEKMARAFGVPLRVVDPEDQRTLRYNPARGEAPEITNKLVGAFSFHPSAQVFRDIAQWFIPLEVKALRAAGHPVKLATLAEYLDKQAMNGLQGYEGGYGEQLDAATNGGRVTQESLAGMRGRLNALLEGAYGSIFDVEDEEEGLDISEALESGITYISMPTMAARADSELLSRVLIQDLKQETARRLKRSQRTGESLLPAMVVMDEFSTMHESGKVTDLLLQSREARVSCVLSSQFLPQGEDLRKALLSVGLLISHALNEQDAREMAKAFGSRERLEISTSFRPEDDNDEGRRMSGRPVEKYYIEPRKIQKLGQGKAAIRLRYADVHRIERIEVEPPAETERANIAADGEPG